MQEKGWNKTYPIEGNESSLRKKNTHRKDVGISGYKWDTGELQIPQAWCYWSVWYQSKHLQIWITSLFRPRTSQPWHLRKCLCYISNPPANCINIKWINHGSKGHYLKDLHKLNKPPLFWKHPRPCMVGVFLCLHLSSRDGSAVTSPLPQRQKWHRNGSKSDNKRDFPQVKQNFYCLQEGTPHFTHGEGRHWCTNGLCKVKRALGWCEQNKESTRNIVMSIRPCTLCFRCILREKNLNFVFISIYSDQDTKCSPGIKCFHDTKTFFTWIR